MLGILVTIYSIYVLFTKKFNWTKSIKLRDKEAQVMALILLFLAWAGPYVASYFTQNSYVAMIVPAILIFLIPYIYTTTKRYAVTGSVFADKEIVSEETGVAWEILKTIIGVALFVVFFRFFIIQPFYIIGSSMLPDFHEGEYLFIDEASYHLRAPERGEVVVFRHPTEECSAFVKSNEILKTVVQGPCLSYIKRVIGLPGETVEIKAGSVTIKNDKNLNGFVLKESYIESNVETLGTLTTTLGNDEYFVLGDNREPNASSDSREWGPLGKDFIIGKAWLRLLPVNEISVIKRADY